MLKVTLQKEGYVLEDVTNLSEVNAVLDGTLESSAGAIYLQDNQDTPIKSADLSAEEAERIMSVLDERGLLSILADQDEALQNANDRLEDESILQQMQEVDDAGLAEDYVFPHPDPARTSKVTSLNDYTHAEALAQFASDVDEYPSLSKEDMIEILQAAANDLLETIAEVRSEGMLFIETLSELLDPEDRDARNSMARAVEALGADYADTECDDETEITFGFQQAQMDRITESVMWAAKSVLAGE